MMNRVYLLTIFFLLFNLVINAQTGWNDLLQEGDEAYAQDNYDLAIGKYEAAIDQLGNDKVSATLFYNLGNAHYKKEHLALAILHWEKAKLLKPNDKDINTNLKIAKESIKGEVIPVKPFFLLTWWNKAQTLFPSKVWGWIAIISLWLGIIGILLWLLSSQRNIKKYGFLLGIGLTVFSIFPFIWAAGQRSTEKNNKRAIITVPMTHLRLAPDGAGDFEIHEGTELEILDQIGEWYKVRLVNSDVGWVKEEEYQKI